MHYGTVIHINQGKGYGFIEADGQGSDVFFNGSGVIERQFDSLKLGDRVSFEMGQGRNGPCAVNVIRL